MNLVAQPRQLLVLLGGVLASATAAEPAAWEGFGFRLLPEAFSSNPRLNMTVCTEVTELGRSRPGPTPAAPIYYVAHDGGMQARGETIADFHRPTPEALADTMFQSLAKAGFQRAADGQPAGIVLIYHWGSHYGMDLEDQFEFRALHKRQVLERAALVGGTAYRRRIAAEMSFGHTFADRTPKKIFLFEQATADLYYVIVSAYDAASVTAGQRQLLWRTTMTVSANGLSMNDGLPPLIATAADYFGRETLEPVAINRRARRGTVTLGPMRIIEDEPKPARR